MPTKIKGQPTSAEIREQLKDMDMPVLLQFSCGKDSIATWIALEDAGIEVFPVYLHIVPGLEFIEDEIGYFSNVFDTHIWEFVHPGLYRQLGMALAQPPERLGLLAGYDYPNMTYDEFWDYVREWLSLPKECYVADGIRANDSMMRRVSFVKHGLIKPIHKKVSPIADWTKDEVMAAIAKRGIELPVDYEMYGRSFDGCDYRFLAPLRDRFPKDYQRILDVFPLAETDIFRHECLGEHQIPEKSLGSNSYTEMDLNTQKGEKMESKPKGKRKAKEPTTDFQRAIRKEHSRYKDAVSDYYYCVTYFKNSKEFDDFFNLLGMDKAKMINGYIFQERAQKYAKAQKKMSYKPSGTIPCEVLPDPRTGVDIGGEYFDDWIMNDIGAVIDALIACKPKENPKYGADSGIYTSIVWANDDDRQAAEMELGLLKYGLKYIDGSKLLADWKKI